VNSSLPREVDSGMEKGHGNGKAWLSAQAAPRATKPKHGDEMTTMLTMWLHLFYVFFVVVALAVAVVTVVVVVVVTDEEIVLKITNSGKNKQHT